jgi:threonine synthase
MNLYSTNHQSSQVGLEEAIFRGLPSDNGLYMPTVIPQLSEQILSRIEGMSLQEIAFQISKSLLGDDISDTDLAAIVDRSINFDAPLVELENNTYVLELFHGPSMAFKDFGARFMAALMSYFLQKSQQEIRILVATSGDTGGAVAQGFFETPGVSVTILYPSGKVSDIQEKQLTTLGKNVTALEVDGTFDDCQALVKQAFLDNDLRAKFNLASANSINIARLIPQSFYFFNAYARLKAKGLPLVFSVPSGNFGNLSAGLIAHRMGMPVKKFVAATNTNDVVPRFLSSGIYNPLASIETISNAMDVGNPSNFIRMKLLADGSGVAINDLIYGYAYDDTLTRKAMKSVFDQTNYVMCPHTAIAYLGLSSCRNSTKSTTSGVLLSTAHYAKFLDVVEDAIGHSVDIPPRLAQLLDLTKVAIAMPKDFGSFKHYLLNS